MIQQTGEIFQSPSRGSKYASQGPDYNFYMELLYVSKDCIAKGSVYFIENLFWFLKLFVGITNTLCLVQKILQN